ncbi:zinc finger protein 862-like [Lissotriton helveticus]
MQALQKLKETERKKLTILFNNAYLIAKQGKPLSDMDILCRAMKKAGVDIGENNANCEKAAEFIRGGYTATGHQKIVSNSRFICIIADGSTDSAITEQETVLVRVVNGGKPYTLYADLVPFEHAHAQGVLDGIVKGIKRLSLDLVDMRSTEHPGPSLIAVNFDGAAVMMGSKGGVAALIKKDIPFLLPFHCVAHKLQLGILDAVKFHPSICQFEQTLKWIFKFYWYSPKRRRNAKEMSRIIDENFAHFTDIKQVRWVSSKTRALAAMQQNLQIVVLHLGQVAAGSDDSAAKAKKYLSVVTSFKFIKNLYSLRDVLKPVSQLSEFFQSNELLLLHVPPAVERCALTLVGLKSEMGEYMQQFKKLYHPEEKKFGDISTDGWEIKLSGHCPPAATIQSDSEIIDSMVEHLIIHCGQKVERNSIHMDSLILRELYNILRYFSPQTKGWQLWRSFVDLKPI